MTLHNHQDGAVGPGTRPSWYQSIVPTETGIARQGWRQNPISQNNVTQSHAGPPSSTHPPPSLSRDPACCKPSCHGVASYSLKATVDPASWLVGASVSQPVGSFSGARPTTCLRAASSSPRASTRDIGKTPLLSPCRTAACRRGACTFRHGGDRLQPRTRASPGTSPLLSIVGAMLNKDANLYYSSVIHTS